MTGCRSAVTSLVPLVASPNTGIAIGDWDDLMRAVMDRLTLTAGALSGSSAQAQAPDRGRWVQSSVLECVAALKQLHASLIHDRGRSQQLELDVFAAQAALAQAPS